MKHKKILGVLIPFISLMLVFVGGFFSTSTHIERIAEYATSVVENSTFSKKLCAVTVGKTPDSGQIADASSEFHNLYGVFKQQKITFASTINADKNHDIQIEGASTNNLSLLYCGAVGTVEYNNHFKHEMLPVEVMFPDERIYDTFRYVIYISQRHADSLLVNMGIQKTNGSYLPKDYETLLHNEIEVIIDNNTSTFGVQNIYFQTNYYYEGLNETIGDFAMVSYYLPNNLRDEQCNMYFLSEYSYQNRYFMNYINEVYSSGTYSVKVNHYNIINDIDENYLLSFYYNKSTSQFNWISVVIFMLSGFLMLLSLTLIIIESKRNLTQFSFVYYGISFLLLFVPYLFFFALFTITNNVIFMSEASSKINGIFILVYIFVLLIWSFIRKTRITFKTHNKDNYYYEVDI